VKKFSESVFFILDSVTDGICVAIFRGDVEMSSKKLNKENSRKSENVIFGVIKDVLANAKIAFPDVDCYAVATGAGSWTGARIGVTVVKALCMVNERPVIEMRDSVNIDEIKRKFETTEFVPIKDLEPYYDGKAYVVK